MNSEILLVCICFGLGLIVMLETFGIIFVWGKLKPWKSLIRATIIGKTDVLFYFRKNGTMKCVDAPYEGGGYRCEIEGTPYTFLISRPDVSFQVNGVPITLVWDSAGIVPPVEVVMMHQKLDKMGIHSKKEFDKACADGRFDSDDLFYQSSLNTVTARDLYQYEGTPASAISAHDEAIEAQIRRKAGLNSSVLGMILPIALICGMVVISAVIAVVILKMGM